MPLRVIPVLDVKAGRAVHAVGGDRAHYQRLASVLHPTTDPVALGGAFRARLGIRQLYLADLDAIGGSTPNRAIYAGLADAGLSCWVDAGVRDPSSLPPLLDAKVSTIVVGLETVRGPSSLAEIIASVGPERVVFSLDLRNGTPLTAEQANWCSGEPELIAEEALALGVRRLLLLDLAHVGRGRGIGTEPLLRRLIMARPELEVAVGGGISTVAEARSLAEAGASAVLVASALHDGRIGRRELESAQDVVAEQGPPATS